MYHKKTKKYTAEQYEAKDKDYMKPKELTQGAKKEKKKKCPKTGEKICKCKK